MPSSTAEPLPEPDFLPAELSVTRPRTQQLEEILEGLITSLKVGDLLPSERQLAQRYGVARMTARQAIEAMESRGLVYRLQGRGTFVGEARFVQPETLTSFSEDMRARGLKPGSTLLSQGLRRAPEKVAGLLQLPPGSTVVRIERLRTADGEPMGLENAYLPAHRFAGLEKADISGSLYALLAERWDVSVRLANQWVTAVRLTARQARLLGITVRQPALQFQRLTRDGDGHPIEYVLSLYRGDRYEVHTRLERPPPA